MILERLKQYIDAKGITIAAFEREAGMSNAAFGKALKNNGAIGTDKLENILSAYPDINPRLAAHRQRQHADKRQSGSHRTRRWKACFSNDRSGRLRQPHLSRHPCK